MFAKTKNEKLWLELFLVATIIALVVLLYQTTGHKLIVLNLFYLPIVLANFFLGRYLGGVMTLFCVIAFGADVSACRHAQRRTW